MPFIPHTEQDVQDMLATIGASSIDDLFDEIPAGLVATPPDRIPEGVGELTITQLMSQRAKQDVAPICFAGGGAYDHHIPAAVWELTTRGEFYSAYTPYQAEASQGTLQLLYEYQTMMSRLTGMDVSNASLYDGASGLAEAVLMAVRSHRKSKSRRVLMPRTLNPTWRKVVQTIVRHQDVDLVDVAFDAATGTIDRAALEAHAGSDITAVVIPQPNYFGQLEDVDALTDWAHAQNALVIAVVNPVSLALLNPPGQWGAQGADIACGEGQPLGAPLSSGGPYFGFLTCRKDYVRQMPGRLIGRTVDLDGKVGYALTLQAREQHIRRSKATSNICTNQGLIVTAATIHMSLMGDEGLRRVASHSHAQTRKLVDRLTQIPGVSRVFSGVFFHEAALTLPKSAADVIARLAEQRFVAGIDLAAAYADFGNALLVCATEKRTDDEIECFASALANALKA
ncbi:MAG: aminomethyl-transferring glycine dehydrogenase subunit GcvPA [Gammaproteobacteria bacterium]